MRSLYSILARWGSTGLLTITIAVSVSAAAFAEPVLTFSVTSKHVPDPRSQTKPTPRTTVEEFPVTVALGLQYLTVEHHGTRTIYDFERRRLYQVDLAAQTYGESSLYTDIGFRVAEFQNRLSLGTMLAAGGVKDNPMVPALTEHLLSLSSDSDHTVVDETQRGDERLFSWKGRELLALSNATAELPPEYQPAYWRFLRYYAGGHLAIYAKLSTMAVVPQMLRIVRSNVDVETRTLRLTGIELKADSAYSLVGLKPAAPPHGAPYAEIAALEAGGAAAIRERTAASVSARDRAFGESKYVNSLLDHFEATFEDGNLAQDWLAAHHEPLSSDADAVRFSNALHPSSPAEGEAAVKSLEELKKADPEHRYLLDVFEGNTLSRLGRRGEAIEHLVRALHTNPFVIGAWFDLGGVYYAAFRSREAWACWDAARAIRPTHPFRASTDKLEERLAREHPEYF